MSYPDDGYVLCQNDKPSCIQASFFKSLTLGGLIGEQNGGFSPRCICAVSQSRVAAGLYKARANKGEMPGVCTWHDFGKREKQRKSALYI